MANNGYTELDSVDFSVGQPPANPLASALGLPSATNVQTASGNQGWAVEGGNGLASGNAGVDSSEASFSISVTGPFTGSYERKVHVLGFFFFEGAHLA